MPGARACRASSPAPRPRSPAPASPVRIPHVLRAYADDARSAFRHAPVEVILGVVVAVSFSVTLRNGYGEDFTRVAFPVAIALPLVLGASVLYARGVLPAAARWGLTAAVIAAAALYGALVFDPHRAAEMWRALCLFGASALAVSLVPAAGRGEAAGGTRYGFWWFNGVLLARVVTVSAYGLALFAALGGAVAAVVGLFELKQPRYLYGDLLSVVFFSLVPWVIAGGVPQLAKGPPAPDGRAPVPVRLLGRYLYFPVLLVYLAILLAYMGKVALTGELPKNLLSPIVLFAGVAGFLGAIFLEPLREDAEHRAVAWLVRAFPALLILLLPLAYRAILQRQAEYGWTEFRYLRLALLVALTVLAVLGTARIARRRPPLLRTVPAVLGLACLLSAVGPWSAMAVSRRDQTARLRAALGEAGLLQGGIVPVRSWGQLPDSARRVVSRPLHDRIQGGVSYLHRAHGTAALRPLFPAIPDTLNGWELAMALPIRPGCEAPVAALLRSDLAPGTPIPGVAGGTMVDLRESWRLRDSTAVAALPVRAAWEGSTVRVSAVPAAGGWTARADLGAVVRRVAAGGAAGVGQCERDHDLRLAPAEALHDLVDGSGRVRGQLVLLSVTVRTIEASGHHGGAPRRLPAPVVDDVQGIVLLR